MRYLNQLVLAQTGEKGLVVRDILAVGPGDDFPAAEALALALQSADDLAAAEAVVDELVLLGHAVALDPLQV